MTDENGSYPIEIYFERRGHDLRKCVYRNVNYGGKIKMKGELLDDNGILLETITETILK